MINQFTKESIHRIADVVRTVEKVVPTLTPQFFPEAGSDVVLIPVRVSDGTDGTYSGIEQTWDPGASGWIDTEGGLTWEPDGSVGPLLEMNQRVGVDGSVFYASFFGDTSEDILWAFFAGFDSGIGDDTIALDSYTDGTGNLRFWSGDVNFGETLVQVSDGGGFDFTTGFFFVEMDATFGIDGADYTINATIQNDTTQPAFYELDGTIHKVRWPLAEINADDELKTLWHGDILDFGLGETDTTGFTYLNEIQASETHGMTFIFDNKSDVFTIGRKTASQIIEGVSEFALDGAEWTTLNAETQGALLVHEQSPVEGTDDDRHWFKSRHEGGVSVDGTDATSVTYYWDTRQHMWGYELNDDGTIIGPPPPIDETSGQNARYINCDGVGSVVIDDSIGHVIKADGECWEFDSNTIQGTNTTADSTYIDCTSCEQVLGDELWFDCDTSAIGVNLSGGHVIHDFAWLCTSGTWTKFYDSGLDATDTATDPSFLLQCDAVPAACGDLVGFPASDNFSGSGCDSGVVDDKIWKIRFTNVSNSVDSAIISGNAITIATTTGNGQYRIKPNNAAVAGNFVFSMDYTVAWGGAGEQRPLLFNIVIGGKEYQIARVRDQAEVTDGVYVFDPDNDPTIIRAEGGGSSGTLEVSKSGSTVTFKHNGGTVHTATNFGTANITLISFDDVGTRFSATWDNFVMEAPPGTKINIDPTGLACT